MISTNQSLSNGEDVHVFGDSGPLNLLNPLSPLVSGNFPDFFESMSIPNDLCILYPSKPPFNPRNRYNHNFRDKYVL